MDFTLTVYKSLIQKLHESGYTFHVFERFKNKTDQKFVVLRHDVDKLPGNSLVFAIMQNELGIKGCYYFRTVPQSFNENIIKQIADMGHEIGYHYENLDITNGDVELGIKDFEKNLEKLRRLYPIKTICMHGSPLSKFDNRDIWKKHNYQDYGIIGEPYLDLDFKKIFYLTDTGRRWDGENVSVRDKARKGDYRQETGDKKWPTYKSTMDIIKAIDGGTFPDQCMMTFHPQRWTNNGILWLKEFTGQSIKNIIKKYWFVK